MNRDQDNAGEMLDQMRTLTVDYRVPEDGCGTYRECMSMLETLERDTHIHIHKENNILFPRGIEAERQRGEHSGKSRTRAG
jgi:regulator of cell morphogenesis and NO signaling